MERPTLSCPSCGDDIIPAHGRGRVDRDGNDISHADACRCRWCRWLWYEGEPAVACSCGARVVVEVEDRHAYASLAPSTPEPMK